MSPGKKHDSSRSGALCWFGGGSARVWLWLRALACGHAGLMWRRSLPVGKAFAQDIGPQEYVRRLMLRAKRLVTIA